MSRIVNSCWVFCMVVGLGVLTGTAAGALESVDQVQDQIDYDYGIPYHAPMGQTFVPTLNGLNFVDLKMDDNTTAPTDGTALIRIREGWTDGTIVGTSETLMLEDCFNSPSGPGCGSAGGADVIIRFNFDKIVTLTPGQTYALEVVALTSSFGVGCNSHGGYAAGTMITFGTAENGFDLWFREGIVPEPSTCAGMLLASAVLARRRRRRSQ